MRSFIGTSGWNYYHWKGRFYPEDISKKDWFEYYSRRFDTVEINYTFYHWSRRTTMRKWHKDAPSNFKFTLKAPMFMTHFKKLNNVGDDIDKLYNLGSLLRNNLGCLLFQLPPLYKFNNHNFEKLKKFIKSLDGRRNNVIEFRDSKWWNKKVFDLLNKKM